MAYKQKNFFEFRDSLPKGDADKVIKGMHFDEEFAAIEGAFEKVTDDIQVDGKPLPELLDEKADQADLEQEIKDRIEGDKLLQGQIDALEESDKALQGNIDGLADDLAQEIIDRQNGDSALDKRIDELATDDLTDVNSATATKDQFLIHNGSQWIAEDFHIDTELTFQGGISVPNDPAPAASNGDLYINNEDGVAGAGWTGIAGRTINAANAVGWSDKNSRWYMLGDIASAAVMAVEPGLGIDVDASKPAEPVVSIDRTEVNKWYEPPIDPKRTAFNKNFGTTADTVAEGNHTHDGDYAPAGHNHDGVYEPVINPKNTAFNKSFGTTAGTVAEGNHTHTTNDLSDVSSGSAKKDDFLIHNGTQWIAEAFHIDTELTYQGAWNLTAAPPTTKNNGDLYINNTNGVVNAGWTGIAGETVREGNVVGWAASKNRWYLLGDIASSAVTQVKAGTAISVDSSAPSEPVVSLDKAETDKWYQPKGNYLTDFTETDPTVPNHVKGITQADIDKWNNPPNADTSDCVKLNEDNVIGSQFYLRSEDYSFNISDGEIISKAIAAYGIAALGTGFSRKNGSPKMGDYAFQVINSDGADPMHITHDGVVQAQDYLDKDGKSIIGAGGDSYTKEEIDLLLSQISGGGLLERNWVTQPKMFGVFEKEDGRSQVWVSGGDLPLSGRWIEAIVPDGYVFELDALGVNGSFANGGYLLMDDSEIDGVAIGEGLFEQRVSNALALSSTWDEWWPYKIDAKFKDAATDKLGSTYHANHIVAYVKNKMRLHILPQEFAAETINNIRVKIQGRFYKL
jgi:hypothetical protein